MLNASQKTDLIRDAGAALNDHAQRLASILTNNTPEEAEGAILMALQEAYILGARDVHRSQTACAADVFRAILTGAQDLPHDMEGKLAPALATVRPMEEEAA